MIALWLTAALAIPPPPDGDIADSGFADADGDGWPSWDDCDDEDPTVYPFALDFCDGKDNDCDGDVDQPEPGTYVVWEDLDGDGYGSNAFTIEATCTLPPGRTVVGNDCDDTDAQVHPGVVDASCDGLDQDCDGRADNDAANAGWYFQDSDADGHGGGDSLFGCIPDGAPVLWDDCDDTDPSVHFGATEIPEDGVDQDCNGIDDPWPDLDGDGFGIDVDCDDSSPSVNPGATEACGNRTDDDCDGMVDEDCEAPEEARGWCSTVGGLPFLEVWRRR